MSLSSSSSPWPPRAFRGSFGLGTKTIVWVSCRCSRVPEMNEDYLKKLFGPTPILTSLRLFMRWRNEIYTPFNEFGFNRKLFSKVKSFVNYACKINYITVFLRKFSYKSMCYTTFFCNSDTKRRKPENIVKKQYWWCHVSIYTSVCKE